ncbi:MAG: hypothetical protein AAGI01_02735 [Myxococcota bacterium]
MYIWRRSAVVVPALVVLGCGTLELDEAPEDMSSDFMDVGAARDKNMETPPGDSTQAELDMPSSDTDTSDMGAPEVDAPDMDAPDMNPPDKEGPRDMGSSLACDYETVNGLLVIEAESLPIHGEWIVASDRPGFFGAGFIEWMGESQNGRPGSGKMEVKLRFERAGKYRMQWRNRIGMGDNPTEHNDTWVSFEGVADSYGYRQSGDQESRRYPKPTCEDDAFIASVEALPEVTDARCAKGSTRDGWFKVYSSSARDWRWSTRTSDHDAHEIGIDIDAPGVYTMLLSARGDHHLIDRIVIHERDIDDDVVHDEGRAQTRCD